MAGTLAQAVQEHVAELVRADTERLDSDCAQAMMLQRYDMLDRLTIVAVPGLCAPRAVASMLDGWDA